MKIPTVDFNPFDQVYLDLDGVFADCDGEFERKYGKPSHQVPKKQFWKFVNSYEFFYSLPLCPGAKELWEYTKQFKPVFLTGLPQGNKGTEQKRRWVAENFGSEWEVIVVPRKNKKDYSAPNRILIDDLEENHDDWVSRGGFGVIHRDHDVESTIQKVEALRLGL